MAETFAEEFEKTAGTLKNLRSFFRRATSEGSRIRNQTAIIKRQKDDIAAAGKKISGLEAGARRERIYTAVAAGAIPVTGVLGLAGGVAIERKRQQTQLPTY